MVSSTRWDAPTCVRLPGCRGLPGDAVDAELVAARDKEPDTIAPINGRT